MNSKQNSRSKKVNSNPQKNQQKKAPRQQQQRKPKGQRRSQQINMASTGVMSAYSSLQKGNNASIVQNGKSCRVQHREFIGNITGSVAFATPLVIALNPGLPSSFPWLSNIAQNWEFYRFKKLRFCFITRTGSTTPGSLLMSPDYDPSDPTPGNEQIASSYEDCVEDAPWKDIVCSLRSQGMHSIGPHKVVRTGSLSANQDIKLYDVGNMFINTVDGTAVAWGKIWVEYDIEFFQPQTNPSGGIVASELHTSSATGETSARLFGSAADTIVSTANRIANLTINSNPSTFVFAIAGTFLVSLNGTGTVITAIASPAGGTATVTSLNEGFAVAATSYFGTYLVTATVGQTFICPTLTATTVTGANLRIAAYTAG